MKKVLSAIVSAVLMAAVGCAFVGCSSQPGKDGVDGINGIDGSDGKNGASAYELFVESHPDYDKSEEEWLNDLAAGRLADKNEYNIVSYGRNYNGTLTSGTASSDGSTLSLDAAVVKLNNDVIVPIGSNAEWEINIGGVLSNGDASAEILTSLDKSVNGRVYFGVYAGNNIAYLGVNVGGIYFNYCWNVQGSVIKSAHDYTVKYKDGTYTLSVDGGSAIRFSKINQNQDINGALTVSDAKVASAELNDKIRAANGQDYFAITAIGADTHKVSCKLKYVDVKTSSIYTYENMSHHPLYGKTVYHLGSSISRGYANGGVSFADQISALTGSSFVKEAVDGTPLVGPAANSYVGRFDSNLKNNLSTDKPAFLVLQLSTNDFSQGKQVGTALADVTSGFDTTTVSGAIEYIVSETKRYSPDTKVLIYTCAIKDSWAWRANYGQFVNLQLKTIANKWDNVTVVDLFNAKTINSLSWMSDDIHPTGHEYANHFTPAMINTMVGLLKA